MKRALAACALLVAMAPLACDDDDTPAAPSPTTTVAAAPTPVPPTTTLPSSNRAPNLVVRLRPDTPSGRAPFALNANLCQTTDPDGDRMIFEYKWGGSPTGRPLPDFSYFCREDHVYTQAGTYKAFFCANDDHDNRVCNNVTVVVTP